MTLTIISGMNRWYPPVSSAIRKIPVSGACITPDIRPAIPTSAKFDSGTIKPHIFMIRAVTNPTMAPMKSEGAKIPPTPPAPLVATEATIFSKMMRMK